MRGQCPTCQRVLGLTERQWSYLELIYKGLSDKEMASRKLVTLRTVKSMNQRIREALGMVYCSRSQLILKAGALLDERARVVRK